MAAIDELRQWFETDLRLASWDQNVRVDETDPDETVVHLYTDVNEYVLTITSEADGAFLDAAVRPRKARAGQETVRERKLILAAGRAPLSPRTWRRLLNSIVSMELVRVHAGDSPAKAESDKAFPQGERMRGAGHSRLSAAS